MLGETTYNWDDIQVGRFDLNHSENFFTQKHLNHEKYSEEFSRLEAMATLNINGPFSSEIAIECKENKENVGLVAPTNHNHTDHLLSPAKDKNKPGNISKEAGSTAQSAQSPPSPSPSNSKHRPANLLTKFKTPTTSVAKNMKVATKVEPPHAYYCKDIYKKKNEERMRKLLEEEKKNRVFNSRPMPKPKSVPLTQKTHFDYILTVPKTPVVLKNSQKAMEKHRQKLEEYKKQNAPQNFISRKPLVLHEEPFKLKKSSQTLVAHQPFNLKLERRLEERKQYDEQNRIAAEERKKQEEEERKKREEELVKQLRKLTSFKARPNPFK